MTEYTQQSLHDTAKKLWDDQLIPANRLIWELRNLELPASLEDSLNSASRKVDLLADQYRILIPDDTEEPEIHFVEVNELDQDDLNTGEYWPIKRSEFCTWYWNNKVPNQDKPEFCRMYTEWLNQNRGPGYFIKPDSFHPWHEDDQDYLIDHFGLELSSAELKPFIDEVKLAEWEWRSDYVLLNDGEKPNVYETEIMEHWIVSASLAHELRESGGMVVTMMGINFWCRSGTGQSIYYDYVFQTMALNHLNGKKKVGQ